jgi:hypothetical protein
METKIETPDPGQTVFCEYTHGADVRATCGFVSLAIRVAPGDVLSINCERTDVAGSRTLTFARNNRWLLAELHLGAENCNITATESS